MEREWDLRKRGRKGKRWRCTLGIADQRSGGFSFAFAICICRDGLRIWGLYLFVDDRSPPIGWNFTSTELVRVIGCLILTML
ncbi:hypothetical protein L484_012553 [Morus notabilis]|uniref:Uncharacterized protein n=1 Tax=Morus notabilis TaxID=981085 RepID=W9QXQ4_9ROSA|nr:hypothetical protein L484_012553 [Morus notabilis]